MNKDVIGYEGLYRIFANGSVYSIKRKRLLSSFVINSGYKIIHLHKDGKMTNYTIHRLVAKHFIPNKRNGLQVNHRDGNKLNNHIKNLEWCTPKENMKHCDENNLRNVAKGEKVSRATLTAKKVIAIRKYKQQYPSIPFSEIGKLFGVTRKNAFKLIHRKTWKHI